MGSKGTEAKRQIMQAMAQLLLQWCVDGVESITIHADIDGGLPYMRVQEWGPSDGDESLLWEWSDFPEEVEW